MSALVAAGSGACPGPLVAALRVRGVTIHETPAEVASVARHCLEGATLVLLDGSAEGAQSLACAMTALGFRVAVREGGAGASLAPLAFRLAAGLPPEVEAHHLCDLLRTANDARRHPRVPFRGRARLGDLKAEVVDVSPFGLRLRGTPAMVDGELAVAIPLGPSGPEVKLLARPVGRHGDDLALRCRPESDVDLVLWVDLILRGLAQSPAHGDPDPFGPLFEP